MELQERFTAFAMLGATWVMWLLVALSVLVVAFALERMYFLLTRKDDIDALRDNLRKKLREGDVDGAKELLAGSPALEASVVVRAMDDIDRGAGAVEEILLAEKKRAKSQMDRNLAFIGTVGNNAPFVGLLGTVIGIIRAFHFLDQAAGPSAQLMSEIGEALVATAIGLVVAIPAVAFFNFFNRLIKARMGHIDTLGHELMAYARADAGSAAGDAAAAED